MFARYVLFLLALSAVGALAFIFAYRLFIWLGLAFGKADIQTDEDAK